VDGMLFGAVCGSCRGAFGAGALAETSPDIPQGRATIWTFENLTKNAVHVSRCRFYLLQLDLRSALWLGCWGLVLLCDGSDDDYLACFLNRYYRITSLLLSFAQLVLPYFL
jgi:hypothetical protein